jgi:dTDP-4-amino-4,6-dideoxygalactose transaminase
MAQAVPAPPHSPAASQFPFLDLKAQFAPIRDEVMAAIERVMDSQHFILGPEVEALEREIANYVGARFAVSCASGSDALLLALIAIGVGPGDEVITTPFTFGATAGSIARLQARPVFVDIDPETYNLDVRQLGAAVTTRTRAIMPVHLFGMPADMAEIRRVARTHDLAIVEDAAQSIGASYRGENVGTIGTFGCFSFFPSKNLGCAGDGGIITTNNPEMAQKLRMLRAHGCKKKYRYECLGVNSRLDALQAAILRVKLQHLDSWTEGRRRNAANYRELFQGARVERWVKLPVEPAERRHVYNQFVIRVSERDALKSYMQERGIPTEIYYPGPLHLQPAFDWLRHNEGDFPNAERACEETLALPIYPELSADQQGAVVTAIAEFFTGRK